MAIVHDLQNLIEGKRTRHNEGKVAAAAAIGTGVGLAAGVLLAPKSGRDTRRQLKLKAQHGIDKGKNKAYEAKDAVKEKADQAVDTAKTAKEEGKKAVRQTKERSK